MLKNVYFLAKIGADTAENEQQLNFGEILPIDRRVVARAPLPALPDLHRDVRPRRALRSPEPLQLNSSPFFVFAKLYQCLAVRMQVRKPARHAAARHVQLHMECLYVICSYFVFAKFYQLNA